MAKKLSEWKEYTVSLKAVLKAPKPRRQRKAILAVRRFFEKNTRKKGPGIRIAPEVNQAIGKNSLRIPKRIGVQAREINGKIMVYLKGSKKALEMEKQQKEKEQKKKEDAKKAGEAVKKTAEKTMQKPGEEAKEENPVEKPEKEKKEEAQGKQKEEKKQGSAQQEKTGSLDSKQESAESKEGKKETKKEENKK